MILTVMAWHFIMNVNSLQYGFVTLDWTMLSRAAVPFFDYGLVLKLDREVILFMLVFMTGYG
jgi:hypothetical protein